MRNVKIDGVCPSCGHHSLAVVDGRVGCGHRGCKEPDAVRRILADPEINHVVRIHPDETFTVRHPLIERLGNRLMECGVLTTIHRVLQHSPGIEPGDYRVALVKDGAVQWERT